MDTDKLGTKRHHFGSWAAAAILGIFVLVYGAIFIQIVFFNTVHSYRVLLQAVLMGAWLAVCFFAYGLLSRCWGWLDKGKNSRKIALVVLLGIFLVQLLVGLLTRQTPAHDYGKIFNGAILFLTQGPEAEVFQEYLFYLHHFSNNASPFLFFTLLFGTMRGLGFSNYYDVAVVLGHLLFSIAIWFTYLYLELTFGKKAALFSLLFWLCFLPVYFQSSVVYTDTLSIWAVPLGLYLHQRGKTATTLKKAVLCYGALGLVMAIGGQMKATVLITAVAIGAEMVLGLPWKKLLCAAVAFLAVFAVVTAGINAAKYQVILDKERLVIEEMPVNFWVMMGLKGQGRYDPNDEWFITTPAGDKTAKTARNWEVIQQRLEEMGLPGFIKLMHVKTSSSFGSANAELYDTLLYQPENPEHWIYRFISEQGAWFRYFNLPSQAVYLSFYVFGIAGAARGWLRRKDHTILVFAPYLSLLGFYGFMLLWESNHRQLVNQWPLFIVVAAAGAVTLLDAGWKKMLDRRAKRKKTTNSGTE